MSGILITYKKTELQEKRLQDMLFGENTSKVKTKPSLTNDNLIVIHYDLRGRHSVKEMDRFGNLVRI